MKKYILVIAALLSCAALAAKKIILTGEQDGKDIVIAGKYESISVGNDIEVRYSSQYKQAHITADKAILPYVKVIVNGSRLEIGYNGNRMTVKRPRKVKSSNATVVTLPWNAALESISASGASSIQMDECVQGENFSISLSGASHFYGRLEVSDLDVNASGASEAQIEGHSRTFNTVLSGACNVDADKFVTSIAKVNLSGASNVRVSVNGTIKGNISGASNLHCYGPADVQNVRCSGAGRVIRHK